MIDFTLTDEQAALQQLAREFAEKEIKPNAAHHDETGEFPMATIKKMGALGLMGVEVPEEYGGAGMDTLAYVLAMKLGFGASGSFWAIAVAESVMAIAAIIIFRRGTWKTVKI